MAVAFVRTHAAGTALKAAGTAVDLNISTAVAAGNTIVAYVLFDNAATASKPIVSSIGKAAGEANNWVSLGAARSTSTSAGSFASGEMWIIKTTVAWPIGVYTVTVDTSTVMKATLAQEFSGLLVTVRSTGGSAYSTTTTAASAATTGTAPVIGDLALGFMFQSNAAAFATSDTDTTAGSWSTIATFGSTGGNATTNNFGGGQYKVLTAATAQTYNAAAALTAGNGSIVAVVQAAPPAAPTARTISAVAGLAAASADLTWTADAAANPAPTYLIERSADGSTGWTTVATGQTGQTGYNVTGLLPSTTYYFRVTGSNASGSTTSNVAGPITTTAFAKMSTFTDDFASLAAWTPLTGTPTVSGGNLQLDYPPTTFEMAATTGLYDLTESAVFCKVAAPPVPATATRVTSIQAYVDAQNFINTYLNQTPGLLTIQTSGTDAGSSFNWGTTTVSAAQVTYLRLSHSGLRFDASYSTDGTNWTFVATGTTRSQAFTDKFKHSGAVIRLSAQQSAADATDPQIQLIESVNIAPTAGSSTGKFKVWTGSAWVEKPVKYWTGSAWVAKPLKVWSGSAWVLA